MPVSLFIKLLNPLKEGKDNSFNVPGVFIKTKSSSCTSTLVSNEPINL